jgi:hypothetical protein
METQLDRLRDQYAYGRIEIEEFEREVGTRLANGTLDQPDAFTVRFDNPAGRLAAHLGARRELQETKAIREEQADTAAMVLFLLSIVAMILAVIATGNVPW